ncbi:hypothetical protein [Bosea sp. 2RAB26]|uniref:hypothetical protein n=1 Tax=Bosea sp. 2RAB26 TaxID=3237476 RepID=UPI003F8EA323
MSACNIIKTDDAIHMFTDAASYYGNGTLGAVGQKVSILAHLNGAISCRGPAGFLDGLVQGLNTAYGSFDELAESFALAVSNVYSLDQEIWALCATSPEVEVFLAGWSVSRDRPESYVVTSHNLHGPAWTLIPLGPVAIAPYDAALDERLARIEPGETIVEIGVALMEQQRRVRGPHAGVGKSVAGVGGFCQMTTIRRESIQTAVIKRWPDQIGEVLGLAA